MNSFHVLQQSPTITEPASEKSTSGASAASKWVPSRFNVRAKTTDGSLVLWNIYSKKMSVFKPELVPQILDALSRHSTGKKPENVIKFLSDRGFLVGGDVDEFRRFQYVFAREHYGKDRLQLFLLASEDCNFRCKYCYEQFARGTMQPNIRLGVKRYLTKQVPRLRRFRLEWFGGEPLYGMEVIADIAPLALELAEKHSVEYGSKITTNAYLLTPDVLDRLLAWRIMEYQITLDGPPEFHNRYRPGRDGSPTFDTILNNLKAMQGRHDDFHVMLRVNFDQDNASSLDQLLDILQRELHADQRFRLVFRNIRRWGGAGDEQLNICTPEETKEVYGRMETEARKRGLLLTGTVHNVAGLGARVCYAARPNSFIIGATGKVMKCTIDLDSNDRNVVGSINETGELILDDNKMALWTELAFERDKKCQKCTMLPTCAGMSCPLTRLQNNESPCIAARTSFKESLRKAAGDFPGI